MAKRVDPLKAKQAKQRKLAIVLGILLVAVIAFQGPKTLKMLKGPQPVAAPTTPTPAPVTPDPTATTPAATPPAQPAVLVDSDQPPVVSEGQLQSFELFRSKDPFEQQMGEESVEAPAAPAAPAKQPEQAPSGQGQGGGGDAGSGTGKAVPGQQEQDQEEQPEQEQEEEAATATRTSIAVNGQLEDVEVEGTFPAADPTFVLVSLGKNGKSVQIGIAGGSYADGKATITLELGKPLTLQNTADGSRYELVLKSVAGFPPPK